MCFKFEICFIYFNIVCYTRNIPFGTPVTPGCCCCMFAAIPSCQGLLKYCRYDILKSSPIPPSCSILTSLWALTCCSTPISVTHISVYAGWGLHWLEKARHLLSAACWLGLERQVSSKKGRSLPRRDKPPSSELL